MTDLEAGIERAVGGANALRSFALTITPQDSTVPRQMRMAADYLDQVADELRKQAGGG